MNLTSPPETGEYQQVTSKTSYGYVGYGSESKGGGQPHNNMPPYYAVYMWRRTA